MLVLRMLRDLVAATGQGPDLKAQCIVASCCVEQTCVPGQQCFAGHTNIFCNTSLGQRRCEAKVMEDCGVGRWDKAAAARGLPPSVFREEQKK